eukprot:snap_masked-scaffold_27-processed-gene-1.35-mRNA-1 protein AED:1.00 eAED:1.00 QI:0/0/0/0/1/1/2/0/84
MQKYAKFSRKICIPKDIHCDLNKLQHNKKNGTLKLQTMNGRVSVIFSMKRKIMPILRKIEAVPQRVLNPYKISKDFVGEITKSV